MAKKATGWHANGLCGQLLIRETAASGYLKDAPILKLTKSWP
jgi:hypothetical protein